LLLLAACAPVARHATEAAWPTPTLEPAELVASFPDSASVQRRQLSAAHDARDAAAVRTGLQRLATLGYAPGQDTLNTLAVYLPEAEMAALRQRFAANAARVQASRPFTSVPNTHRLVEGIAWDSRTGRLFAATVVSRALLVREATGWRAVEGLEAGSLFALAIDPRRRLLWAASGVVEQTPDPAGAFRGLIGVDLGTLRPIRRLAVPGEGSPADIGVAADGTVYAADPNSGAIYRARPGDAALSVLVPPGRLRSPQGLVPSTDGRRLYVSDYGYGLAEVHLSDGTVARLESDANTMLDGIDGLYPWRGGLLAIQNGTSPRRILWLSLSPDGERIAGVRVLESNHPDWGEPTLGFVRRGDFLYVADAQWERYGEGGAMQGDGPLRATTIRLLRPPN
jgi:DNA-binding beta-propeller fold protein YncE